MVGNENQEIELMDILNVIWKRKWLVIIPTFFCMVAAAIISFLSPPKWEIDALILPSKYLIKTEGGQLEEVIFVDPEQIVSQINQATYNNLIASELNLDMRHIFKLKAENLRGTNLVRVSLRDNNVEKAKRVLLSLFKKLKEEMDNKAIIEDKEISFRITLSEISIAKIEKENEASEKKLSIIKKRITEISDEMIKTKIRIESLKNEQLASLEKLNRTGSESLGMLLYSNEIQQSLIYYDTLSEQLSNKKIQEEDLKLQIETGNEQIKLEKNQIENLNEKKGRIDFTELIKEPTSSASPVLPRKKLNIVIAAILSFLIFILIALYFEYMEKQKVRQK